jgi:hypothetical protein
MAPPIFPITLAVLATTRKPLRPSVHKGKGLLGYAADEGDQAPYFWDYDASDGQTSSNSPVFDRTDRAGLWFLRGDRRFPDALKATLLPNLERGNRMQTYGSRRMGPSVVVTIQKDVTDPYTWNLGMEIEPFPHKQFYQLRNEMRGAKPNEGGYMI